MKDNFPDHSIDELQFLKKETEKFIRRIKNDVLELELNVISMNDSLAEKYKKEC